MHQYTPTGFNSEDLEGAAAVVLVNYNGREQLSKSLPVWEKFRKEGYIKRIIIVDNASTDSSRSFIQQEFPETRLLENDQNLGWGVAVNRGVEAANTDYVFVSTPDMIPTESWCFRLIEHLDETPKTGLATSIVVRPSGKVDGRGANADSTFRFRVAQPSDSVNQVDTGRGSALIVRKDAYVSVGGIDEDLFIQGGENNLSFKLRENGWNVTFVPGAYIWHCEKIGDPNPQMVYYSTRNLYILASRHLSVTSFVRVFLLNVFYHTLGYMFLFLLGRRSEQKVRKTWHGVLAGTVLAFRELVTSRFELFDC